MSLYVPNAFAIWTPRTKEVYIGRMIFTNGAEPIWMTDRVAACVMDQLGLIRSQQSMRILNITKSKHWESKYKELIESGKMNPVYGTWRISN